MSREIGHPHIGASARGADSVHVPSGSAAARSIDDRALALLAGCGGGPEVIESDDIAILIDHDYDGSMDALLQGRLTNVEGCLGVEQSEVPGSYAVIWSEGLEVVREDPFTVRFAEAASTNSEMRSGSGAARAASWIAKPTSRPATSALASRRGGRTERQIRTFAGSPNDEHMPATGRAGLA